MRFLLILSIFFSQALSAQQFDQNWLLGTLEYPGNPAYGNAMVQFLPNDSIVMTKADLKMNFERTLGLISDSLGQLLFFTNGCYIATASGDTMMNGAGINPGDVHEWVCPENGYIVQNGAMVVPAPGKPSQYFLFHLGVRYTPDTRIVNGPMYFSVIDMEANNGAGAVLSKNNVVMDELPESFAVIRHGNGRDWWLIIPSYKTNQYYTYRLDPTGLVFTGIQSTGPASACSRIGSLVASPDGRRLARIQNCKTTVLDFDRCSGVLANKLSFDRLHYTFGGGGGAFTPDGSTLIMNEYLAVLKADLEAAQPVLDTLVPFDSITGQGTQMMALAPNGRWYFSQNSRGRHFAELRGTDASEAGYFNRKGLAFPVANVKTIPYFPNYRLYDLANSICDTLGINTPSSTHNLEAPRYALKIYPNPAQEQLNIEVTGNETEGTLRITNVLGHKMLEQELTPHLLINTARWPSGLYSVYVVVRGKITHRNNFVVIGRE